MHMWRRKLALHIIQNEISYKMKYLQNETRKQKSIKEVTLQFSMIFQIRLKNNNVNFRVIYALYLTVYNICTFSPYTFRHGAVVTEYLVVLCIQ